MTAARFSHTQLGSPRPAPKRQHVALVAVTTSAVLVAGALALASIHSRPANVPRFRAQKGLASAPVAPAEPFTAAPAAPSAAAAPPPTSAILAPAPTSSPRRGAAATPAPSGTFRRSVSSPDFAVHPLFNDAPAPFTPPSTSTSTPSGSQSNPALPIDEHGSNPNPALPAHGSSSSANPGLTVGTPD